MNKKTLTLNGLSTPHILLIVLNLAIVAVSVYLTKHFYEVSFPTGLAENTGLCSGKGFFSCDKTTLSMFGSFFNIPTAFLGILVGCMGLLGSIFTSEGFERTNKFINLFNLIGCLVLFLFSLIFLQSLCPFCSVYYILSAISFLLYMKYSDFAWVRPDFRFLALGTVILIVPSIFLNSYYAGKMATIETLNADYIRQFNDLKDLGDPQIPGAPRLHSATEDFNAAPLRVSIFSDFQCPFCKVVSTQAHQLMQEFGDKINVQYLFYPLDSSCNKNVQGRFHDSACLASYLAACDPKKFPEVHDYIFENQEEISQQNVRQWADKFELTSCFDNEDVKDLVVRTIAAGDQYQVKSTPTLIINGKKIEGTIPTPHLKAILRAQLK